MALSRDALQAVLTNEDLRGVLERVRPLDMRPRTLRGLSGLGAYRSRFRGQGMEFDRVREYNHSDDIRAIDWNVTARVGRPFVKVFREERELSVMLLVDISGSMRCGGVHPWSGRNKLLTACEIAGVFAMTAQQHHDRVGLQTWDQQCRQHFPIRRGRRHAIRLLGSILDAPESHVPGNMVAALQDYVAAQRRHSIVVVISDFLDPLADLQAAVSLTSRHHQVIGVQVTDPSEEDLPHAAGPLWLADGEGRGLFAVPGGVRAARRYRAIYQEQMDTVRGAFRRAGCDFCQVGSDSDVSGVLGQFFQQQRGGRGL
ncbi:MAG: DUF58 domain-containing protein [Planctomycetota bacterium]|nr:MAG: DUF58 domain-containing protein [Planctomycetota bacterium]